MANTKPPALHFGWQLDVVGNPPPKIPVLLKAKGLKAHTAIIAQSGSGKSFALGRLLEEIASRTNARIVILDPNSDFSRFREVNKNAWRKKYLKPWFGEEDTHKEFERRWKAVGVKSLTLRPPNDLPKKIRATSYPISIRWGGCSLFEMCDYLGYSLGENAAETFIVNQARKVAQHNHDISKKNTPYTLELFSGSVNKLWNEVRGLPKENFELPPRMSVDDLAVEVCGAVAARCFELETYELWDRDTEMSLNDHLDEMTAPDSDYRVVTVDLPSLSNQEARLCATQAVLDSIANSTRQRWEEAMRAGADDQRSPTFIVIDEAHNLAPSAPNGQRAKAVTDSLVTIAAEGRKYGLFLILVTQRPSRLNTSLLSQCDNLCLLRMSNRYDLQLVEKSFGFVPEGLVDRALGFGVGDCLLAGNFVERPVYAHVAPRRTIEGGRNLNDAHWTKDPLDDGTDAGS